MNVALPLLSTAVSLVFAGTVFAQYIARRRPHQLVWAVGLLWFAVASWSRFLVGTGVWNDTVYRVWYLFGAFFVAAYLGMGTIYLLAPRRPAHALMLLLAAGSVFAAYLLLTVPVNLQALPAGTLKGDALPGNVRVLTPIFNIFGSAGLIGGALYSAWVLWQKRLHPQRVASNVLIAAGAFLPTTGGTLMRFGIPDLSYILEFVGVVVIFAGFLANHEVIASRFAWRTKPASSS